MNDCRVSDTNTYGRGRLPHKSRARIDNRPPKSSKAFLEKQEKTVVRDRSDSDVVVVNFSTSCLIKSKSALASASTSHPPGRHWM